MSFAAGSSLETFKPIKGMFCYATITYSAIAVACASAVLVIILCACLTLHI